MSYPCYVTKGLVHRTTSACGPLLVALLLTAPTTEALDANWIAGDGNYSTAANWDTAPDVPLNGGVTYDVFIVGSGTDVTYNAGAPGAVASLNPGAGVTFLTDLPFSVFSAGMTLANDATLIAEDQSHLNLGGGNLDRSSLIARMGFLGAGGAQLTTTVSSWAGTNGFNLDRQFTAEGAGSLLDLSSLTSIERNGGSSSSDLSISASDGGEVRLTGITGFDDNTSGINGRLHLSAVDAGSKIDLANVTALDNVSITVQDGGDITGQLTSLTGRSQLLKRGLDDADGDGIDMIDLSQLTDADDASLIAEDGATLALGATRIDRTDLIARMGFLGAGGAQLTTTVSSWAGTNGFNLDRQFTAEGAGSLLDLSSLTSIERNGGSTSSDLSISASDGGEVRLTGITGFDDNTSGINGRLHLSAVDAGSKIDLANVTALDNVSITVQDGGDITGQLTSLTGRSQLLKRGLDDADGDGIDMIDLSQLTDADDASLIAEDGATLALGATRIDRTDLIARMGFLGAGGAQLTTTVSSWAGTNGFNLDRQFTADGAGSLLDLSSLTSIERNGGSTSSDLSISASDGGEVRLTGINGFDDNTSGVNGRLHLSAVDAGSKIDLANVTALDNVSITVQDGGDITGQLTSLTGRSQLLKRGLDDADGDGIDMIDLSQLTDADDASLIAEDGATLALGATRIDRTDLIARMGFLGAGGAQLTTTVSSWAGTNGFNLDRQFTAEGAGSLVDLSSLTSVERNGGSTSSDLTISASDGGEVRLTGITGFDDNTSGINGRLHLSAVDAGSKIDLANVTALDNVSITVQDGGDITGQLTSLTGRSQLLKRGLDDADGDGIDMIDLSQLTDADDASLIAEDGATLALGATRIDRTDLIARMGFLGTGGAQLTTTVSSWAGTNGFNLDRQFTAEGAGSLLDLSSLTSIERNGGSSSSDLSISASDGGEVRLTGITGFDDNTSGINGRLRITASGTGSSVDLSNVETLTAADVTVNDDAAINLRNLGAFSGGTLALTSTVAGAGDFHVAATFELGDLGTIDVAGSTAAVVIGPGTPAGAADGSVTVAAGGSFGGTGSVVGTLVNHGHLAPGLSPGMLSVDGAYEQGAAATLALEIGGLAQGLEFDFLDVTGTASLTGVVEVSLFDAYVPTLGSTYVFLEAAGGISGVFDGITCVNCGGVAFELVYGADNVSLNAVAAPVPLPAAVWLLGSAFAGLAGARRHRSANGVTPG